MGLRDYIKRREISDEVTEDIFDMSKERFLKGIERGKMADVYTLLAELRKAFALRNLCFS